MGKVFTARNGPDRVTAEAPEVPPYARLSRLRARGATLMFGDRLVEAANTGETAFKGIP